MPDKITGPISAARTLESLHNYLSRGYLAVSFRTGIGIATYQGDEEIFSRGKKMLKAEEINVNDGHASDYLRKGIADICSALVRNGNGRSAERDIAPLNHACTFDLHRIAMNCVPLSSQFAASPVGRKNSAPTRLRFLPANQSERYANPQASGFQHRKGEIMATKNIIVFCTFPHRTNLEYAISGLKVAGFRDTDFSVLLQENQGLKTLATENLTKNMVGEPALPASDAAKEETPVWLMETRECNMQGDGAFLISGPYLAMLTEMQNPGQKGGLNAALRSVGIPEKEIMRYHECIKGGGILLSVDCPIPGWVDKAKVALRSIGAENICSTLESLPD